MSLPDVSGAAGSGRRRSPPPRRTLVGLLALLLTAQYFLAEAVTAAGWVSPTYSFTRRYISDLGVTDCAVLSGRDVCSPLHAVMNTAFVVQGLLVLVAVVTLSPNIPWGVPRWAVTLLWTTHAVGVAMVGLFPGSLEAEAAGNPLHSAGAVLAIGGGNLATVATGLAIRRYTCDGPRAAPAAVRFAAYSVLSGVLGLSSLLVFDVLRPAELGLWERLAANPVTLWCMVAGLVGLLAPPGRSAR